MSFCVKCGDDCETVTNGLCIRCFLDGRKLTVMPHHTDLQMCANCGEFRRGDRWVKKEFIDAVEDAAVDSLSAINEAEIVSVGVSSVEQDVRTYSVTVEADLDIDGHMVQDTASTIIRVKNTVCRRCSRQLGSYYESILQIRTGTKNLSSGQKDEVLGRILDHVEQASKTNRQLFISKVEAVTGGIDVYLSSIPLGKALAKELSDIYCAETKEAAKLVGQTTDGQDMYRVTYLVRLPEFHVGDVIILDGGYYKMEKVYNGGGKIISLKDFRERTLKRSEIMSIKVYSKGEDLKDAIVISKGEKEIQILHPSDYSTVDLRIPADSEIPDTVKVVDVEGTLYYVP